MYTQITLKPHTKKSAYSRCRSNYSVLICLVYKMPEEEKSKTWQSQFHKAQGEVRRIQFLRCAKNPHVWEAETCESLPFSLTQKNESLHLKVKRAQTSLCVRFVEWLNCSALFHFFVISCPPHACGESKVWEIPPQKLNIIFPVMKEGLDFCMRIMSVDFTLRMVLKSLTY